VAGYLRSNGDALLCKVYRPNQDRDHLIAAVQAGQRDILNNLLPQLGLACIEATEKPSDGIRRLMQMDGTEQELAALGACERWLKSFIIPISSSMISSGEATSVGG
jgi:hypothetical protein